MCRISGAGFWHFRISDPDPDPANRLPDIRPDIRNPADCRISGIRPDIRSKTVTYCSVAHQHLWMNLWNKDFCNNDFIWLRNVRTKILIFVKLWNFFLLTTSIQKYNHIYICIYIDLHFFFKVREYKLSFLLSKVKSIEMAKTAQVKKN